MLRAERHAFGTLEQLSHDRYYETNAMRLCELNGSLKTESGKRRIVAWRSSGYIDSPTIELTSCSTANQTGRPYGVSERNALPMTSIAELCDAYIANSYRRSR